MDEVDDMDAGVISETLLVLFDGSSFSSKVSTPLSSLNVPGMLSALRELDFRE